VLVLLGLWVRLTITETPVFQESVKRAVSQGTGQVGFPMGTVLRRHLKPLVAGTLTCVSTFVIFYLMTVFALSWGTTALHYSRGGFLQRQLFGMLFFAAFIPVSAWLAERGRRRVMVAVTVAIGLYGLVLGPLFSAGIAGVVAMLALGLTLTGMTYGPLGTVVSEMFPTRVRYTGSSLAFSMGGILGASFAPSIATWLAKGHGINFVGYYLTGSAVVTLVGLVMVRVRETKGDDLNAEIAEVL